MALPTSVPFERRSTHRYKVKLPVELILEGGAVLPVESIDISNTGLQFSCDSWVADEIEPRGIQTHPLDQIRLKAVIDFPGMDKYNSKLYARCRIIVARRLSQDEYLLGLQFKDFENGSERLLEKFIKHCEQKFQNKA
ncbi:MAG: PilZ domain-containing protein [Gammaproteobacteria bacterium]|nr:PilZ domain-containing protein [Gammaproteobacteria bacterium]NNL06632.1 PilZ domain-containing protein [Gammaproteobacteria bacterium]